CTAATRTLRRRRRHCGPDRAGRSWPRRLNRKSRSDMADLIVALDLPSSDEALGLVDRIGDAVGWYKVGSPLFTRTGPRLLEELAGRGKRVFLDLKFHDIPSTVANAVESATSHGV